MSRTDDLQIRIMRELTSPGSFRWNIRESYGAIAERLKVDEETVRRGVNRARELGFLKAVQLVLNPHLIGRESAGIQTNVEDPEKKQSAVTQVQRLDGVVIIINFLGKPLRTIFYCQDEQAHARTSPADQDNMRLQGHSRVEGRLPPSQPQPSQHRLGRSSKPSAKTPVAQHQTSHAKLASQQRQSRDG